jgi:hypothetical protein
MQSLKSPSALLLQRQQVRLAAPRLASQQRACPQITLAAAPEKAAAATATADNG